MNLRISSHLPEEEHENDIRGGGSGGLDEYLICTCPNLKKKFGLGFGLEAVILDLCYAQKIGQMIMPAFCW